VIDGTERRGVLRGMTLVEPTGGNTPIPSSSVSSPRTISRLYTTSSIRRSREMT
jgi:hypothetical protein